MAALTYGHGRRSSLFARPEIASPGRQSALDEVVAVPERARGGTISFEHAGKVYRSGAREVNALEDIDLKVAAGCIFGIIGRSGAGKSSLLRTINRLEDVTSGRVLVDGGDIAALDSDGLVALRRRIGMIFQHFNLLSAKTVYDNVALPLLVAGVPKAEIRRRVDEVLALVGLSEKRDIYPSRLSGGQKQRVGIARALVHKPEILLCDEATSALDPETTLSILQLLRQINNVLGLTIVLITHEMSVIREICDDVLVLENGRAVECGPVWRVFGDPQHEATRALLEPLSRDLPRDIADRLHREASPGCEAVVELRYTGRNADPDLSQISSALGARARLLSASLDRLGGHLQGRILVAVPASGSIKFEAQPDGRQLRILGYV